MPAGRANLIRYRLPVDLRLHFRSIVRDLHIDEPRVRARIGAEAFDMACRGGPRRGDEPAELIVVAVENGDAARHQSGEDFRFRVCNRLDARKEFKMHGRDRGDDGDMRFRYADKRRDFAGMIHADFDDAEIRLARHAGERQRHAPMIVVGRNRGMNRARRAQHEAKRLFGRCLADRACDGDDPRFAARARRARQPFERRQDVADDIKWAVIFERIGLVFGDDRGDRALGEGGIRHNHGRHCFRL